MGTIKASKHCIAAFATTEPPHCCPQVTLIHRCLLGPQRVLPSYAVHLHPLDSVIAGKQSRNSISWPKDLLHASKEAQKVLSNAKTITLPCHQDELWIVTDASI